MQCYTQEQSQRVFLNEITIYNQALLKNECLFPVKRVLQPVGRPENLLSFLFFLDIYNFSLNGNDQDKTGE